MLRMLVFLTFVAVLAFFGATVKLGQRTFFGHISAIWSTDEAQDMRKGLEEKAGPALDRVKRGVEAGIKAAARNDGGPVEGSDAGPPDAPLTPDGVPAEAEPAADQSAAKPNDQSDKRKAKPSSAKRPSQATQ